MTRLVTRLKRTEHPLLRDSLLRGRGYLHYAGHGHVRRASVVRTYLAGLDDPKLQIGSGPKAVPGWLNSDLIAGDIYVDLGRRLPFQDSTFAWIFGEHVIEHITENAAMALLRELHRILRPGGVLRLTTPDLKKILAIYEDRNPVISREAYALSLDGQTGKRHETACQVFNDFMRLWGHRFIYDEEDLTAKLLKTGFSAVTRWEAGKSGHEAMRGLERHGAGEWVNQAEAMCLEATR